MEIEIGGKREHVSQTVGKVLVLAGLATEVKPDPLKTGLICKTTWRVFNQNTIYPPSISWTCATCCLGGDTSNVVQATQYPVRHGAGCFGHEEYPPADVVACFEASRKRFDEASKKTPRQRREEEKSKRVLWSR